MSKQKRQCCVDVWSDYVHHQCSRSAVVIRDGKPYCRQHDPVAQAEKKQAAQAKYEAEWADRMSKWRLEEAAPDLLAACKALVDLCRDHIGYNVTLDTATVNKFLLAMGDARSAIAKAEGKP
jgi:hypothetical protein